MKKLFIPVLAVAILAACSERSEIPVTQDDKTVRSASTIRSIDAAASLANQIFASGDPESRSATAKADRNSVHVITSVSSRSGASDTLLYAVDNTDGGFALIAARYSVEPVLAIIDEGSYTDPENLTNEPYQQALAQTISYVETANPKIPGIPDPPGPVKPVFIEAFYLDTIDINKQYEPSVKVAWGQGWPENIFAPNHYAGCVPVAIAQLLSVFEKPEHITYTFSGKDLSGEYLNWSDIKNHRRSVPNYYYGSYCVDCSSTSAVHRSIGRLVREIGQRVRADYSSPDGTSADTRAYAANAIQQLANISSSYTGDKLERLFYNLEDYKGVAIVRADVINSNKEGHAWIADAIRKIEYTIVTYMYNPTIKDYTPSYDTRIDIKLIHFNWGWGGKCNGWFNIGALDPSAAEEYDYPDEYNQTSNIFANDNFYYIHYKKAK